MVNNNTYAIGYCSQEDSIQYFAIENEHGFTYMMDNEVDSLRQVEQVPHMSCIYWKEVTQDKMKELLREYLLNELEWYASS